MKTNYFWGRLFIKLVVLLAILCVVGGLVFSSFHFYWMNRLVEAARYKPSPELAAKVADCNKELGNAYRSAKAVFGQSCPAISEVSIPELRSSSQLGAAEVSISQSRKSLEALEGFVISQYTSPIDSLASQMRQHASNIKAQLKKSADEAAKAEVATPSSEPAAHAEAQAPAAAETAPATAPAAVAPDAAPVLVPAPIVQAPVRNKQRGRRATVQRDEPAVVQQPAEPELSVQPDPDAFIPSAFRISVPSDASLFAPIPRSAYSNLSHAFELNTAFLELLYKESHKKESKAMLGNAMDAMFKYKKLFESSIEFELGSSGKSLSESVSPSASKQEDALLRSEEIAKILTESSKFLAKTLAPERWQAEKKIEELRSAFATERSQILACERAVGEIYASKLSIIGSALLVSFAFAFLLMVAADVFKALFATPDLIEELLRTVKGQDDQEQK